MDFRISLDTQPRIHRVAQLCSSHPVKSVYSWTCTLSGTIVPPSVSSRCMTALGAATLAAAGLGATALAATDLGIPLCRAQRGAGGLLPPRAAGARPVRAPLGPSTSPVGRLPDERVDVLHKLARVLVASRVHGNA